MNLEEKPWRHEILKKPKPVKKEPEKKKGICTVQERMDYLCWSGGENDQDYNDVYPVCSGTDSKGKLIGFSDPSEVPGI